MNLSLQQTLFSFLFSFLLLATPLLALTPQLEAVNLGHLAFNVDNNTAVQLSKDQHLRRQAVAAGGGIALTTMAPSQYPTSTYVGSLFTIGTSTSATWKPYTQTFVSTALGTWALGPTPLAGTIGLGSIQGTVGAVKPSVTKRALPTHNSSS